MEHYKSQRQTSLIDPIIGILILMIIIFVVFLAGYHMGELDTLRKYAERKIYQPVPLEIYPKNETRAMNYMRINFPCKVFFITEEQPMDRKYLCAKKTPEAPCQPQPKGGA